MMDRFEIVGSKPLAGCVSCSGSKNATLPIMAAALLARGVTTVKNVPDLQDIRTMSMVLRVIGADVRLEDGKMTIDSSHCSFHEAPYELVRKMRASFYVLGPLLARFRKARVSLPGGCALGPRPVNLHLKAMEKLGCAIELDRGYVVADGRKMRGTRIDLDIASVGATGNVLMAAVSIPGRTKIHNAACEPEIIELAEFLNAMGARIDGMGTPHITVEGGSDLQPVTWSVAPDRIEAGTFLIAGAITGGCVQVEFNRPDHMAMVLDKLSETGVHIEVGEDAITLDARGCSLKAVDVTTAVYPGFPTDLQAPWTSLMAVAGGGSTVRETVYPERFSHVPELLRLGARVHNELGAAYIDGVPKLTGTSVMCSDIRAAAAIVLAALAAKGRSEVLRVYHIDRGYQRMEEKLKCIGAEIKRIRD